MTTLYFDVRDIFRAVRLGWNGKRMTIAFGGWAVAYLLYAVTAYIALLVSGAGSWGDLWDAYRFFPNPFDLPLAWYGGVICAAGLLGGFAVLLLSEAMIGRVAYQQIKGDAFYSMGDALRFIRKHGPAVVLTPLVLLGVFVFLIVSGLILGGLARIPYVGPVGFALLFIPTFSVALATLFLGFVFLASLILAPAIVGTAREDTLETIIQVFSTVWKQPWRLLLYELYLLIAVAIGTAIVGCLSFYALYLIFSICGVLMGETLTRMAATGFHYVPMELFAFPFTGGVLPYPDLLHRMPQISSEASGVAIFAGRILALMLLGLAGFVASYPLSALSSGEAIIYLILKKKKDNENLLERRDMEEPPKGEAKAPEKTQ